MTPGQTATLADINSKIARVRELTEARKTRELSRREKAELATINAEARRLREQLEQSLPAPGQIDPRKFQWDAQRVRDDDDESKLLRPEQRVADWVREQRGQATDFGEDRLTGASFGKTIRAAITGDHSRLNDAERRALGEAGGSGQYLVAPSMSAEVVDAARAQAVAFKMGAGTLVMQNPTEYIPRLNDPAETGWHEENQADLPGGDQGWDRIVLSAKTVTVGPLLLSRELAEDVADSEIDRVIRGDLAKALALAVDYAVFEGNDAHGPVGISNTSGVNVITADGGGGIGKTPTDYSELVKANTAVEVANGTANSVVWHPAMSGTYDLLVDGVYQPLRKPGAIGNLNYFTTSQLSVEQPASATGPDTASNVYLLDGSTVVVGVRPTMSIRLLEMHERYADNLQIGLLAYLRCDVAVRRPSHVSIIKRLIPAS